MEHTMQTQPSIITQRMGRGKIRDRRSRSLGTKLTIQEEQELARAAEADGKSASEWAREVLLREARRSDDALFTELVATRMLLVNLIKPLILGEKVSPTWITEAMTMVRKEKHKAAQDVMQQYTQDAGKER
jgi:hypothetical protein